MLSALLYRSVLSNPCHLVAGLTNSSSSHLGSPYKDSSLSEWVTSERMPLVSEAQKSTFKNRRRCISAASADTNHLLDAPVSIWLTAGKHYHGCGSSTPEVSVTIVSFQNFRLLLYVVRV